MSPWLSDLFLSTQSDERLVELARAGHESAFTAIVERYRRPLDAFARRLTAEGRAEDLVQQTFLYAFTALRSGTEVRHLRGWLHQILRHAALRPLPHLELELDPEWADDVTSSAQEVVEARMHARDALAALTQLPSRQHEALVGTAIQGRSRAEVATSMGLSEGAVRQLVHRARATLRTAVTAFTPYPLARALAATRSGPGAGRLPEAVWAGSASVGGIAAKVGVLLATGAAATGVLSFGAQHPSHGAPVERRGNGTVIANLGSRPVRARVASYELVRGRGEAGNAARGARQTSSPGSKTTGVHGTALAIENGRDGDGSADGQSGGPLSSANPGEGAARGASSDGGNSSPGSGSTSTDGGGSGGVGGQASMGTPSDGEPHGSSSAGGGSGSGASGSTGNTSGGGPGPSGNGRVTTVNSGGSSGGGSSGGGSSGGGTGSGATGSGTSDGGSSGGGRGSDLSGATTSGHSGS